MKNQLRHRCPVCGHNELKRHFSAKDLDNLFDSPFTLQRCRLCNLIFLGDIVKTNGLYNKAYYRKPNAALKPFFDLGLYLFILDRIRFVKKYVQSPGKILDVGCGDGAFLLRMKERGWRACGVDSSPSAAEYLEANNLTILGKDFLHCDIEPKSFDVITYWYSFEHLSDPAEHLKRAYGALCDNGTLIISVQNIESLQAVFSRDRWFHLDLPWHVLHFSPQSLKRALTEANFKVLDINHNSLQMNIFGWHQSLLNRLGCKPNFLYKLFKRGNAGSKKEFFSLLMTLLASPFIFPLSVIFSKAEELCRRGGVITAIAKKRF